MGAIQFQLALTDTFGPKLTGSVIPALGQTDKMLGAVTGSVGVFESSLDKAASGAGSRMSRFFTFDLAHGAEMAIGMVKDVGRAFFDLGKDIVKTAADFQDINLAVRLNVGSEGEKAIQELADKFKSVTRYDDDRFKKAWLPLLESGIRDTKLLSDITATAADLSTRTGGRIGLEDAIDAFHKIGLKGEIDPKILRALNIGQAEFYTDLGKKFQVTGERAKELASKGKLDKVDLINAAIDIIAKRQGGNVGSAAVAGGGTLGASLERLNNLAGNVFKKIADGPGIKSIQGFIDNLVSTLDSDIGGALVEKLDRVFTTLFGDLSGPEGAGKMRDIVLSAADALGDLVTGFQKAWPDIKDGFGTLWDIAKGLGSALKYVYDAIVGAAKAAADLAMWLGIAGGRGGVSNDSVNDNSPSWKRARAGLGGSLEDQVPHFALGGVVDGPGLAMVGENGPELIVPLSDIGAARKGSGGFGGGSPVNVTLHVSGAAGDPQALAQAIRAELVRAFAEIEASSGAAEAA